MLLVSSGGSEWVEMVDVEVKVSGGGLGDGFEVFGGRELEREGGRGEGLRV